MGLEEFIRLAVWSMLALLVAVGAIMFYFRQRRRHIQQVIKLAKGDD